LARRLKISSASVEVTIYFITFASPKEKGAHSSVCVVLGACPQAAFLKSSIKNKNKL